jgi:gag-polypeptide of LTR copia-type/Zinc knuckle
MGRLRPEGVVSAQWEKDNEAICRMLILAVSGQAYHLIRQHAEKLDGAAAFRALLDKYEGSSEDRCYDLYVYIMSHAMTDGNQDVMEYILAKEYAIQQLETLGETISERGKKAFILNGLHDAYETIKTFVRANSINDGMSYDKCIQTIKSQCESMHGTSALSSENRRQHVQEETALYGRTSAKGIQCYKCKQMGHIGRHCKQQQQQPSAGAGASGKWYHYHKTSTHSNEECQKQQSPKLAQANFSTRLALEEDDVMQEWNSSPLIA